MSKQKREETFEVNFENISLSNSFGTIRASKNVKMEVTVGFIPEEQRGYFEMYDVATGGDTYYAEGALWFDGMTLTDYDGVFSLSEHVVNKLKEWGCEVAEFEEA